VDKDEPGCENAGGHDMEIICQKEAGDEILIDLGSLVEWSIIPANEKERAKKVTIKKSKTKIVEVKEKRGSMRSIMKFHGSEEEDDFESNKKIEGISKRSLKDYTPFQKRPHSHRPTSV
jgi:hypothetical protein